MILLNFVLPMNTVCIPLAQRLSFSTNYCQVSFWLLWSSSQPIVIIVKSVSTWNSHYLKEDNHPVCKQYRQSWLIILLYSNSIHLTLKVLPPNLAILFMCTSTSALNIFIMTHHRQSWFSHNLKNLSSKLLNIVHNHILDLHHNIDIDHQSVVKP